MHLTVVLLSIGPPIYAIIAFAARRLRPSPLPSVSVTWYRRIRPSSVIYRANWKLLLIVFAILVSVHLKNLQKSFAPAYRVLYIVHSKP